jgi:NCAIR mutase (PurE)-related protein
LYNDRLEVEVFVSHEEDGQLDFLHQMLGEEPLAQRARQGNTAARQEEKFGSAQKQLHGSQGSADREGSSAVETRPDTGREQRKGAPEVIFGETKETAQVIEMAQGLLISTGRAIISRLKPEALEPVKAAFHEYVVRIREAARMVVIYTPGYVQKSTGGHVGIISAGTSDIPVAEEAATIVEEMGCRATYIYDVGVAGLHRLIGPLRELLTDDVDAIIVAAGMDGALPSVVAGLVPVPVIGLPTSIGYGMGGKGVAALLSMLQTCAPGLSVVNIDNGVGAGITAALIANRVAQARGHHQSQ